MSSPVIYGLTYYNATRLELYPPLSLQLLKLNVFLIFVGEGLCIRLVCSEMSCFIV